MQALDPHCVCVVTVTYGDRWKLLVNMVDAATAAGVSRFVVVCNGITENYRAQLEQRSWPSAIEIRFVFLARNMGSAVGFKRGIETAVAAQDTEFVWLLDDDNMGYLYDLLTRRDAL